MSVHTDKQTLHRNLSSEAKTLQAHNMSLYVSAICVHVVLTVYMCGPRTEVQREEVLLLGWTGDMLSKCLCDARKFSNLFVYSLSYFLWSIPLGFSHQWWCCINLLWGTNLSVQTSFWCCNKTYIENTRVVLWPVLDATPMFCHLHQHFCHSSTNVKTLIAGPANI